MVVQRKMCGCSPEAASMKRNVKPDRDMGSHLVSFNNAVVP